MAPQVRIPPSARVTGFPTYPGKSASGVRLTTLKGGETRNPERRSISTTAMNDKSIHFHIPSCPARRDISR